MDHFNQNQSELSVLTFNTWGLRVGIFSIARKIDQRMKAMVAELKKVNADVISLQEVWTDASASFLYHNLDYKYYFYKPGRQAFKGYMGNGLLTLSKYPIVHQETTFFSRHTTWFEYYANKGVLKTQIETPAGYVNVLNTHLGSGNKIHHARIRKQQLGQVLDYVRKLPAHYPVVIAGDFNFIPSSDEYRYLDGWMRRARNDESFDTYAQRHPGETGYTFYNDRTYRVNTLLHGTNERIDYIFALCSKENRSSVELLDSQVVLDHPEFPLSDHCGVLARFLVRQKVTINEVIGSMNKKQAEPVVHAG